MNPQAVDVPDYAKGDRELWTVKRVREVLVQAELRMRKTNPRVGPRADSAYWPPHLREHPPERRSLSFERWMTVDRMEQVMEGWVDAEGRRQTGWLAGPLLAHPELQQKLIAWIDAAIRDESSTELCHRMGWSLATFKRHRDRAAGIIAMRLNAAGIEVW